MPTKVLRDFKRGVAGAGSCIFIDSHDYNLFGIMQKWQRIVDRSPSFSACLPGHEYGSIVVDLERRQVIDLLPDRQRETVIAWLRENPQVEIICRDRGPGYVAVATEAAAQARQVADRWHLFENASAAFLTAVRSEMPCLRRALAPSAPVDTATLTRAERLQWDGAQIREALNRQIQDLAGQGVPIRVMARTTGIPRQTIRKILRGQHHDTFRNRQCSLDAWSLTLETE